MPGGHAILDRLHAASVEGSSIVLWVTAQRRMLGITIEQSIMDFIDAGRMDPSNFDRLRKLYDRRVADASDAYDFDKNKCINCTPIERKSRGR